MPPHLEAAQKYRGIKSRKGSKKSTSGKNSKVGSRKNSKKDSRKNSKKDSRKNSKKG